MNEIELRQRIAAFPRWHYQFDLAGQMTPVTDRSKINRHRQRRRYFFDPLVKMCGGGLEGRRVLDLGCNAGYWSLAAIEHGCDYVMGVDGRAIHIEQAQLVFEVHAIEPSRYRFVHANVFDLRPEDLGSFDVVLCLGLLYHVGEPMRLLDLISKVNRDLLVIDTNLSLLPGSVFEVKFDDVEEPRSACDHGLVLYPSLQAVLDLVAQFGYRARVLQPNFSNWDGAEDFREGSRRAFLCARLSDVDG